MIAALYILPRGPYYGLPDVEPWGLPARDARLYRGPHPVVAHPPCARWGRYWCGGPSARERRPLGDDGGCFVWALDAVRRHGGVLEHPAYSYAWSCYGLMAPPLSGGCPPAGDGIGWTCHVEQGHYGHRARKPTWLYAVRCALPSLRWGRSAATVRQDGGFRSTEERRRAVRAGPLAFMSRRERSATPMGFRDLLISIARSARFVGGL